MPVRVAATHQLPCEAKGCEAEMGAPAWVHSDVQRARAMYRATFTIRAEREGGGRGHNEADAASRDRQTLTVCVLSP